jgi:hypothetical protein
MKSLQQIEERLAELRPKLRLAYEHMRPSQPFNVREPATEDARRLEATIKALEWVLEG